MRTRVNPDERFRNGMRSNFEKVRINPLTDGGFSYERESNTTATAALEDYGVYTLESMPLEILMPDGSRRKSDHVELMRSPLKTDPDYVSFGVVSPDYQVLQPIQIAEAITKHVIGKDGKAVPITGLRTSRDGSRLIFSSEIKKFEVVSRQGRKVGDEVGSHIVWDVPFTPGSAIVAGSYTLRLACTNGSVRRTAQDERRVIHRGNIQASLIKLLGDLYLNALSAAERDEVVFNLLAQKQVNDVEIQWILNAAYPYPARPEIERDEPDYNAAMEAWEASKVWWDNARTDTLTLFNGAGIGSDMETMQSAYGVVQSVSQYVGDIFTSATKAASMEMLGIRKISKGKNAINRGETIKTAIDAALKVATGNYDPSLN